MTATAQRMTCGHCGNDEVARDAWAGWDVQSQSWRLTAVFDYVQCHDCDAETTLQVEEVSSPTPSDAAA